MAEACPTVGSPTACRARLPALHEGQRRRGDARAGQPAGRGPSCGSPAWSGLPRRLRQLRGPRLRRVRHARAPASFGLFGGYFYNILSQARLMGARMPGASPEAIDEAYFDSRDEVPPYKEEPWHQSQRHAGEARRDDGLGHERGPPHRARRRARPRRPSSASSGPTWPPCPTPRCWPGPAASQPYLQQMFEHHVWASLGASLGPGALGAIRGLGDPTMAVRLIAGIGEVDSAAPSWACGTSPAGRRSPS